ncbi:MAG: beta-lactamase family protein [Caldilineaceae bacterium]|nr:beta-lactamase family protein [Caldilineaceae bacterium]
MENLNKTRIIQILRIIMPLVGLTCIVVFAPWDGIWAWIKPLPDTVQEQVDAAIGLGLDGMIVYVDEAGEPPAFYTAGWKNREDQIPADPQSLFKIASIEKLYVAVSIAKLINDQRLSPDDTLADHFPELVGRIEYADQITLRMMVQHRSGIPNFTDAPGYWENPPDGPEAALELALDLPADFVPDEEYGYSNTNYLLLSELIVKVVGYSHWQYIEEEILIPLALNNTYTPLDDVDADDVMSGYWVGLERDLKNDPHGSMLATAEDVGIFLRALNDGSLLNEDEQYSYLYEYGHSGLIPGYYSIARYHSDIDTVVVQFVNTTGGAPIVPLFDTGGGTKVMVSNVVYNRVVRILRGEIDIDE